MWSSVRFSSSNKKLQPTLHAVSVCVNDRASHFVTHTAAACNAAELSVRIENVRDVETKRFK